jgi:hypothetical protein
VPGLGILAGELGRGALVWGGLMCSDSTDNSFSMTLVGNQKGVTPELCRSPFRRVCK